MALDVDRIDETVLALLHLGLHDGTCAWKSFDWDTLARLHEKGLHLEPGGPGKKRGLHSGWFARVRAPASSAI